VKRYFPHASHQVLLLSTDEEIAGRYYEALRPSIDRTYRLRFDEAERRTVIEPGYLPEGADAHGH
jgi:DNA sulfur modification protein DndD